MLTRLRTVVSAAVLCAAPMVMPAAALARADEPRAQPDQRALVPILAMEWSAPTDWFIDPKDAGLRRAVRQMPERLRYVLQQPELAELRAQAPPALLDFAVSRFEQPGLLAIGQRGFDPDTGQPLLGAVLSFGVASDEAARAMHRQVETLRAEAGGLPARASTRFDGMSDVQLPLGVLSYGPRDTADGMRYEFIWGAVRDPDAFHRLVATDTQLDHVIARGTVDFSGLYPIMNAFNALAQFAGAESQVVSRELKRMGLLSEDAIAVDFAMGHRAGNIVQEFRVERAGRFQDGLNLTDATVDTAIFGAMPSDTTFASVRAIEPDAWLASLREAFASVPGVPSLDELLRELEQRIGIDLAGAFIEPLGGVAGFYLSDATGGGSLLSAVALVQLDDPAPLREALDELAVRFNRQVAQEMDTRLVGIRVAKRRLAGATVYQFQGQGLPSPFEPTIAVGESWLVAGATTQALIAAVAHIDSNDGGLVDRPVFRDRLRGLAAESTGFSFIDSQRTLQDGVPTLSMLTTFFEGLVRSPGDADVIAPIAPPYAVLRDGIEPAISRSFWDGEDYVYRSEGDGSYLANLGAVLGVGDAGPLITGFIAGLAIGGEVGRRAGDLSGAMDF